MGQKSSSALTNFVLDFDGTCTQIAEIAVSYLEQYRLKFIENVGPLSELEWQGAKSKVCQESPKAAWMLSGAPSAPAAADPFILADEAAKLVLRSRGQKNVLIPAIVNSQAYSAVPAPWREEACDVIGELVQRGAQVHFISNSSSTLIRQRLAELFGSEAAVGNGISVASDAGKFRICELSWERTEIGSEFEQKFLSLPAESDRQAGLVRPIYLRRGAYFEAICSALRGDLSFLSSTVFCGDIWEMDLAMPFALGAKVHLIERAPPFSTYPYEHQLLANCGERGRTSSDLRGLLEWFPN